MTSGGEERETVKRARVKPTNVSQSLGRLTHIKTRTVIWLRTIEKLQAKDAPVSAALHDVPASVMLEKVERGKVNGAGRGEQPVLRTPLAHWGAETTMPVVAHTCSFCTLPADPTSMHVSYNFMLPLPYTVSCAACVSLCVKT